MQTKDGLRTDYYDRTHKKNLPSFIELGRRISKGILKIIDIRIDEPQFGHRRVVIMLHDAEEE
jgi:hypothetical protein